VADLVQPRSRTQNNPGSNFQSTRLPCQQQNSGSQTQEARSGLQERRPAFADANAALTELESPIAPKLEMSLDREPAYSPRSGWPQSRVQHRRRGDQKVIHIWPESVPKGKNPDRRVYRRALCKEQESHLINLTSSSFLPSTNGHESRSGRSLAAVPGSASPVALLRLSGPRLQHWDFSLFCLTFGRFKLSLTPTEKSNSALTVILSAEYTKR